MCVGNCRTIYIPNQSNSDMSCKNCRPGSTETKEVSSTCLIPQLQPNVKKTSKGGKQKMVAETSSSTGGKQKMVAETSSSKGGKLKKMVGEKIVAFDRKIVKKKILIVKGCKCVKCSESESS